MAMSILPKFLTLKWNISRTIWRIEVCDGSFFCIFYALSLELNFVFDRRFPLNTVSTLNGLIKNCQFFCLFPFNAVFLWTEMQPDLSSHCPSGCSLISFTGHYLLGKNSIWITKFPVQDCRFVLFEK